MISVQNQPQSRSHRVFFMIRLPKALLEEIGSSAPTQSGIWCMVLSRWQPAKSQNLGRSKGQLSRKDNRKLGRVESKKRKAGHHTTKQRQQHKRPAQKEHENAPVAKKPRVSAPPPETNPRPNKKTPLQKLVDNSSGRSDPPKSQEEDKEDVYIRYLEAKLGWKNGTKTSAYGSGLADDGLDGAYRVILNCSSQFNCQFHLQSSLQIWTTPDRRRWVRG